MGSLKLDMVKSGNKQQEQLKTKHDSFFLIFFVVVVLFCSFLPFFFSENQLTIISLFCDTSVRICFKNRGIDPEGSKNQLERVPNSSIMFNRYKKINNSIGL